MPKFEQPETPEEKQIRIPISEETMRELTETKEGEGPPKETSASFIEVALATKAAEIKKEVTRFMENFDTNFSGLSWEVQSGVAKRLEERIKEIKKEEERKEKISS